MNLAEIEGHLNGPVMDTILKYLSDFDMFQLLRTNTYFKNYISEYCDDS